MNEQIKIKLAEDARAHLIQAYVLMSDLAYKVDSEHLPRVDASARRVSAEVEEVRQLMVLLEHGIDQSDQQKEMAL